MMFEFNPAEYEVGETDIVSIIKKIKSVVHTLEQEIDQLADYYGRYKSQEDKIFVIASLEKLNKSYENLCHIVTEIEDINSLNSRISDKFMTHRI